MECINCLKKSFAKYFEFMKGYGRLYLIKEQIWLFVLFKNFCLKNKDQNVLRVGIKSSWVVEKIFDKNRTAKKKRKKFNFRSFLRRNAQTIDGEDMRRNLFIIIRKVNFEEESILNLGLLRNLYPKSKWRGSVFPLMNCFFWKLSV